MILQLSEEDDFVPHIPDLQSESGVRYSRTVIFNVLEVNYNIVIYMYNNTSLIRTWNIKVSCMNWKSDKIPM